MYLLGGVTDYVNPRDLKLWYAHDGILLLDLYESSGTEMYHYTTGRIEAEDFTVKSGTAVWFKTNDEPVLLKEGFFVESGAEFLVTTN